MKKIVLVEDDPRLAHLVKSFLQQHGFDVTLLQSGEMAVQTIKSINPDLVILDIMLPNKDGYTICREIKGFYTNPVIFLTAKDSPIDHVMGLEIGADDYIIKPVDPHVLLARIHAVQRRNQTSSTDSAGSTKELAFGVFNINQLSRTVTIDNLAIDLTSHEFELLWLLASNAGQPLSREHIHQVMIGREYDGLDRTVDVRVSRLRKKLFDDTKQPMRIVTVWGKGYMFSPSAWQTQYLPHMTKNAAG